MCLLQASAGSGTAAATLSAAARKVSPEAPEQPYSYAGALLQLSRSFSPRPPEKVYGAARKNPQAPIRLTTRRLADSRRIAAAKPQKTVHTATTARQPQNSHRRKLTNYNKQQPFWEKQRCRTVVYCI